MKPLPEEQDDLLALLDAADADALVDDEPLTLEDAPYDPVLHLASVLERVPMTTPRVQYPTFPLRAAMRYIAPQIQDRTLQKIANEDAPLVAMGAQNLLGNIRSTPWKYSAIDESFLRQNAQAILMTINSVPAPAVEPEALDTVVPLQVPRSPLATFLPPSTGALIAASYIEEALGPFAQNITEHNIKEIPTFAAILHFAQAIADQNRRDTFVQRMKLPGVNTTAAMTGAVLAAQGNFEGMDPLTIMPRHDKIVEDRQRVVRDIRNVYQDPRYTIDYKSMANHIKKEVLLQLETFVRSEGDTEYEYGLFKKNLADTIMNSWRLFPAVYVDGSWRWGNSC
jgi:hypothetical protein